jgi:diguanylate cyclase (GGDEF)-like protein/PAS domain S-box-containing protein
MSIAPDFSSSRLARRALLITAILAFAGSGLGIVGVAQGAVTGLEIPLVISCVLFAAGVIVTLLLLHDVALQKVATVSTSYFALYLCAGTLIALYGRSGHPDFFIFLVWFFPLLAFNKLVNAPDVGRRLAKILLLTPLVIVGCSFPRLLVVFKPDLIFVAVAYCLSYVCYGLMLNVVTRYREEYLVERERAESFKVGSAVLESISDCFISLDSGLRLVYLNDAACSEFSVARAAALNVPLEDAVPAFFSDAMFTGLQAASSKACSSTFEAQNQGHDRWYELRCFPQTAGMSIYFRNITEVISSRLKLDEAHAGLREQAELLDKAQDAIFVQDMEQRVVYWNKGAERLYGWTAADVLGQRVSDVLHGSFADMSESVAGVLQHGEWSGELSQSRRDGSLLIVESRCALVRSTDGRARSILAINTDITNRKTAEAKIEHLAFYDVLTELPNRSLLRERLERSIKSAGRRGSMGAILFIDLDDFKTLNDTLGHDIGDLFLAQVARRLTSCVRASDTVARLGGDEFVIMLDGLSADEKTAAAEATAVADTILGAFLEPYPVGNGVYNSSASIGIALFGKPSDTVDDLLKWADLAMYRAKGRGRNAMCFFDPAMQTFVASRAALQADTRHALANGEFELHYQPQVDSSGRVTGAEALLRWPHPRRGMVPPMEFIPLAEEAGLIVELGRWVLETACAQLAKWALRPDTQELHVAVNVSLRQFRDPDFVTLVLDVLRRSGADPHRLKLEITESSVIENVNDTIAKITTLKYHNVGFSLDDFGTGYASQTPTARSDQDRSELRNRRAHRHQRCLDRSDDHCPWPGFESGGNRRGGRNSRAARLPRKRRLPRVPGLSIQPGIDRRCLRGLRRGGGSPRETLPT